MRRILLNKDSEVPHRDGLGLGVDDLLTRSSHLPHQTGRTAPYYPPLRTNALLRMH
jgi:hypothetical protein